MKRKAEHREWSVLGDCRSKSARQNLTDFTSFVRDKSSPVDFPFNCESTPGKPIPVQTSTPFSSSNSVPQRTCQLRQSREGVMDADAEAELRKVVDNFVSIYEQLDKCEGVNVKPNYSYTELAYLAMLRSPNFCLPITEIYSYIQSRFLFFKNSTRKHWKNAVRHSLAKTMCFTKIPIGRGISNSENLSRSTYLWCIIPNSIVSFARGDYRPSVDKESGTNTLRWGYMRVNAGQFWDQVGNYIASRMASFREYLQDSPNAGQIFEQQVCRLPDTILQPTYEPRETFPSTFTGSQSDLSNNPFGCYGNKRTPQHIYRSSVISAMEEPRMEPLLAVPTNGYLPSPPFCKFENSPLLKTMNSLHYNSNQWMRNSTPCHNNGKVNISEKLIPPCSGRFSPPHMSTLPCIDRSTPHTKLTPPYKLTPTYSLFNSSDSGFESCGGSSPEVEPSSCQMISHNVPQLKRNFNLGVPTADFLDEDLQLDFSDFTESSYGKDFNEPELFNFCDSLLTNSDDIKSEHEIKLRHRPVADLPTCLKENIPIAALFQSVTCTSEEFTTDTSRTLGEQQQQQQCGYHGNSMFSGSERESGEVGIYDPQFHVSWPSPNAWF